jgi:hypothetical protein
MKIIRFLATDYAVLPSLQCDLLHRKGLRVLNDLKRAKLSCGRMIRLHTHPPSPSPVSNMSLFLSLPVSFLVELSEWRRGKGVGVEPNHTTAESLALSKSFNTLWKKECLGTFIFLCICLFPRIYCKYINLLRFLNCNYFFSK